MLSQKQIILYKISDATTKLPDKQSYENSVWVTGGRCCPFLAGSCISQMVFSQQASTTYYRELSNQTYHTVQINPETPYIH